MAEAERDAARAARSDEVDGEDTEADVFASYFLMPEALFVKEWDEAERNRG